MVQGCLDLDLSCPGLLPLVLAQRVLVHADEYCRSLSLYQPALMAWYQPSDPGTRVW